MIQRVIIRADADKTIGYGHFFRSLALASYVKEDFECLFASFNALNNQLSEVQLTEINKVAKYLCIDAKDIDKYNYKFLQHLQVNDIVVLDNYFFSADYQQRIIDKGCKLISLDDMHDRHFVSDLLFSLCPNADELFDVEPYTKCIGGIEWSLLRKPFYDIPISRSLSVALPIKKIVVAMGGSDQFNLTNKIVNTLLLCDKNLDIHVLLGSDVCLDSNLLSKVTSHRNLTAEQIVNLFDSCDIGIFSVSTVCFEALSRKMPVIAGWYVNNQYEFYTYLKNNKFIIPIGNLLDGDISQLKNIILKELSNIPRLNILNFGRKSSQIKDMFIELANNMYLRPVRNSDKDILFEWANDFNVRRNSFNTKPITYDQHCAWFNNCVNNPNIHIYILVESRKLIGQVRINVEDREGVIGYSIAEEFRGKGYGNIIIKLLIQQLKYDQEVNIVKALVKNDNIASHKVFLNNGFKKVLGISEDNKTVYTLSLN